MKTRGGQRTVFAGVVALFAVTATGCNEHASSGVSTPSAAGASRTTSGAVTTITATTSVPASPTSGSASIGGPAEQQRIRAARDAKDSPTDLIWRPSVPPKSWTKLPRKKTGQRKYFVKPGCYIWLWQLDGAGSMTQRAVLESTAAADSSEFPGHPKPVYRRWGTIKLAGVTTGIPDLSQLTLTTATVDYGKARAQVISYRNGDLALTYTSTCSTAATFKKVSSSDFDAFRDKLIVETTY